MPLHRVQNENLARGLSGTSRTIDRMHALVAQGKLDPTMQRIAAWVRLQVPEDRRGAGRELAEAIFRFTKDHGIFTQDPFQIEQLAHPIEAFKPVIEARQAGAYRGPALFIGDCDQYSILVATLGGILGYQYAFETAKLDGGRPEEFSHVWPALYVQGQWLPLDASTTSATPGWRPPMSDPAKQFKRWEEKPIEDVVTMSGSNGMGDIVELPNYEPSEDTLDRREFVYGRKRFYGQEPGAETVIPDADAGVMQDLVEDQPAEPSAYVEGGFGPEFEQVKYWPDDRVEKEGRPMDPNAYPPPRYRPGPRAMVTVQSAYPTGWPWARQAETHYDGETMTSTIPAAGAAGMGASLPTSTPMSPAPPAYDPFGLYTTPQPPVAKQAEATDQTLKTISDVVKTIAGTVSSVDQARLAATQARLNSQVTTAALNLSGQMPPPVPMPPAKLTTTELAALAGGAIVVVGGILYFLSR